MSSSLHATWRQKPYTTSMAAPGAMGLGCAAAGSTR